MADRLGVTDLYVRAAFLVLTLVWGVGLLLYLVLWGLTLERIDHAPPVPAASPERKAGYALMFVGAGFSCSALSACGAETNWCGLRPR